jgi:hypothetical protein
MNRCGSDARRGEVAALVPNNTSCSVIRTGSDDVSFVVAVSAALWPTPLCVADVVVNCDISPPNFDLAALADVR